MTVTEVPVAFFVLFAVGVVSTFGWMWLSHLLSRRLGLTWVHQGSKTNPVLGLFTEREWTLSKDHGTTLRKALWGGNGYIQSLGVFRLVWTIRLLYATVAATVLGCALTLFGAAK